MRAYKYFSDHPNLARISLAIASLVVYVLCMPMGYSWLNFGVDGGDLLSAALTNGIAHPSGYPLYTLLIRLLIKLVPLEPALVTNLLDAILIVASGQLLFSIFLMKADQQKRQYSLPTALLATILFLFAPLVWSHATITEVYPLHIFLLLCLIWLSAREDELALGRSGNFWIGVIFGLGMANHLTFIFALPFLIPAIPVENNGNNPWYQNILKREVVVGFAIRVSIVALVSALLYLSLLLTSTSSPVRWQDPQNFHDLLDLISGKIYHGYLIEPGGYIWQRVLALPGWLVEQIGGFGLFLGLWGIAYTDHRSKWRVSLIILAISATLFSVFYPVYDSTVHLFPLIITFCFWVAVGIGKLAETAKGNPIIMVLLVILLLNTLFGIVMNWSALDISKDTIPRDAATLIFEQAPENAVLLADNDKEIFTLWYYHDGLVERSDLTVIAEPLTHLDWYQRVMSRVMLPMTIPVGQGSAAWQASNPETIFCEIINLKPAKIECVP